MDDDDGVIMTPMLDYLAVSIKGDRYQLSSAVNQYVALGGPTDPVVQELHAEKVMKMGRREPFNTNRS